jgi:hypothetical protein
MSFSCNLLYLQDYSTTLPDPKQEKNNTKPNYFNKLTQSTFYGIINYETFNKWASRAACQKTHEKNLELFDDSKPLRLCERVSRQCAKSAKKRIKSALLVL